MISRDHMIQALTRYRQICPDRYPQDIDTISPDERAERLGTTTGSELTRLLLVEMGQEPIEDICRLAKTPRLLKLVLRRTLRAWETLHGEIDFDDLLVANVIRFSAPEAFDFILENIQEIRGLEAEGGLGKPEDRLRSVEAKWARSSESCRWDTTSAKKLVKFLFPAWNKSSYSRLTPSPQGIHIASPTDYWSRFLAEELELNEIRDQEVIYSLREWRTEPNGIHFRGTSLPEILSSSLDFASKFEQFAPITLSGHELRSLATGLFTEAIRLNGVHASSEAIPGFIPLWRRTIRQPIDEGEHLLWVREEIRKALPLSFRFANDIYYYFSSNTQADIHGNKEGRTKLRGKIISEVKDLFAKDPSKLVQTIDPKYMYSSYHFCVHYSSLKEGGSGFKAEEWRWFAQLLIEAGSLNQQVIIPQIACLVVDEQHRTTDFTYSFNHSIADELFRDQLPSLIKLLATDINLEHFDLREAARIKCANDTAVQWLLQHPRGAS